MLFYNKWGWVLEIKKHPKGWISRCDKQAGRIEISWKRSCESQHSQMPTATLRSLLPQSASVASSSTGWPQVFHQKIFHVKIHLKNLGWLFLIIEQLGSFNMLISFGVSNKSICGNKTLVSKDISGTNVSIWSSVS